MNKYITNRREIAKALNFGKYPVVFADLKTARTSYGWCLGDVRLDHGEEFEKAHDYRYEDGDLYIYNDNFNLTVSRHSCCIKSDFGAGDVFEMAHFATAPAIPMKEGQEIILVLKSAIGAAAVIKAKIGVVDRLTTTGITPFKFEDPSMKEILKEMGEDVDEESVKKARYAY